MRRRRLESSGATSANWSKLLHENKHRTERQGKKRQKSEDAEEAECQEHFGEGSEK